MLWLHRNASPVKSQVFRRCQPAAGDLENADSVPVMPSAPRSNASCFLRTKSDGAIDSSRGRSSKMSSVVAASNKPLSRPVRAMSGSRHDKRRLKNKEENCDVQLKRRNCDRVTSYTTQNVVYSEVVEECTDDEYDCSVESTSMADHGSGQDLPTRSLSHSQSSNKRSDGLKQDLAMCWDRRYVGSTESSAATSLVIKKAPVGLAGQPPCNSEIVSCTAMPLLSSNIVNFNHSRSFTGQNTSASRQRIIVLKLRNSLPMT